MNPWEYGNMGICDWDPRVCRSYSTVDNYLFVVVEGKSKKRTGTVNNTSPLRSPLGDKGIVLYMATLGRERHAGVGFHRSFTLIDLCWANSWGKRERSAKPQTSQAQEDRQRSLLAPLITFNLLAYCLQVKSVYEYRKQWNLISLSALARFRAVWIPSASQSRQ